MMPSAIELRGPTDGGEEAWLAGTDTPVSDVLHHLGVAGSVDALLAPSMRPSLPSTLSKEAVLDCVKYALAQVLDHHPRPQVGAAFEYVWRLDRPTAVGEGKRLAKEALDGILLEAARPSAGEFPRLDSVDFAVALSYATAIVRNGRFPRLPDEDSSLRDSLDPRDRKCLEDFYVYRREIASFRLTPERHVERWKRLVDALTSTYNYDLGELVNELDGRDIFEDAVSLMSPVGRGRLRSVIDPLDARFYDLTDWTEESLDRSRVWRPLRWWWFRAPARARLDSAES